MPAKHRKHDFTDLKERPSARLGYKGVGLQPENPADRLLGFTMVAYSPRLWLMAAGETSSTSIKN
eukprot:1151364-Pelagomonas_calceolata.AAC.1